MTEVATRKLHDKPSAAAQLSISVRVLDQLIADGILETVTIGRRRLVPDEALDDYVQRLRATS
jgi:excisionase family DNA binding protein